MFLFLVVLQTIEHSSGGGIASGQSIQKPSYVMVVLKNKKENKQADNIIKILFIKTPE